MACPLPFCLVRWNMVYSVFLVRYGGTIKCRIVIYVPLNNVHPGSSRVSAWVASVTAKIPRSHGIGKTGCQRKYPAVNGRAEVRIFAWCVRENFWCLSALVNDCSRACVPFGNIGLRYKCLGCTLHELMNASVCPLRNLWEVFTY